MVIPDENVLDRAIERMSHVQYAGHVGRRYDDRIRRFRRRFIGVKKLALRPIGVPFVFDKGRIVLFVHYSNSSNYF